MTKEEAKEFLKKRFKSVFEADVLDVLEVYFASSEVTIPEPEIKFYRALISQNSTDNPTIKILENTTGKNFTFSRDSQGYYKSDLSSVAQDLNKVFYNITQNNNHLDIDFRIKLRNDFVLEIFTGLSNDSNVDGHLVDTPIELIFYK